MTADTTDVAELYWSENARIWKLFADEKYIFAYNTFFSLDLSENERNVSEKSSFDIFILLQLLSCPLKLHLMSFYRSCEPSPLLLRGEMMKAGFQDEDERLWEQSWRMWEDRGGERGDSMTAFS
ncbi:hypothetical protein ILYODFUR_033857 [Ilyodon furcidens]|uniref:Uncharacterized protein n=1 Tax=Ilyodon furcidens TaxID=33524 RepID=A0ABV0TP42_9TELE